MFIKKDERIVSGEEDIKSLEEKYVEYLLKLDRSAFEAALEHFRLNLASKGIFISITILDHEEKNQASLKSPDMIL